jgi:hypothetical protein
MELLATATAIAPVAFAEWCGNGEFLEALG